MLFRPLKSIIEQGISLNQGRTSVIQKVESVGGGCINSAYKLTTAGGDFFLKLNDAARYPQMFEAEAKGLALLASTEALKTAEVVLYGDHKQHTFIILKFIHSAARSPLFWENFGRSLANLHRNSAGRFGLDHDNYIGSLLQSNKQRDDWTDFFIHERLQKQIALANKNKLLTSKHQQPFEQLFKRLSAIFPAETPALLHGDLWSGNFLTGADGEVCLIDPAVYYGHREMELAFTRLFGGFDGRFYAAYHEAFPVQPGFERRVEVYNLYPLLVHLNLFGLSYLGGIEGTLRKFG